MEKRRNLRYTGCARSDDRGRDIEQISNIFDVNGRAPARARVDFSQKTGI